MVSQDARTEKGSAKRKTEPASRSTDADNDVIERPRSSGEHEGEHKWTEIERWARGCWQCFVVGLRASESEDGSLECKCHLMESEATEWQRPSDAMAEGIEHMLVGMRILRESCRQNSESMEALSKRLLALWEPAQSTEWQQDSGLGFDSDELGIPSTPPSDIFSARPMSSYSSAVGEHMVALVEKRKSSATEDDGGERKRHRVEEYSDSICGGGWEQVTEESGEDGKQSKQPTPSADMAEFGWRAEPALLQSNVVAEVRYNVDMSVTHSQASELEELAYGEWFAQYQRNEERGVARDIRRIIEQWRDRCGICWLEGRDTRHTWDKCVRAAPAEWKAVDTQIKAIMDRVLCRATAKEADGEWRRNSGCWRCGMPAWICQRFEFVPKRWYQPKAGNQRCSHGGLLAQMVSAICVKHPIGAAYVIAQKKMGAGQERVRLDSQDGVDWLVDWDTKSKPEASNFIYVAVELERYARVARRISHGI